MPAAGAIIAAAAINAAGAFFVGGLALAAKVFFVSLVLGALSSALAGRVDPAKLGTGPRTLTVRDAAAARRIVLGETRLGGVIAYMTTTDNDTRLHLVVLLCDAHDAPIEAIPTVWLDDEPVLAHQIDSEGWVAQGRFAGKLRIRKHPGGAPQAADADLVAEVAEWTADHRLDGIAYLYLTLLRDDAAYPAGIPNVSAEMRGLAVVDPRDAGTRWTRNMVLLQHWWLQSADWGLGAPDAEIHAASAVAAANLAEEAVPVATLDADGNPIEDAFTAKFAADWFERATITAPLGHKTDGAAFSGSGKGRVTLSTTGVLPAPLVAGRVYYAIAEGARREVFRLAASAEDARKGIGIAITDAGSGVHTLSVTITRNRKDDTPLVTVHTDDFTATATPGRLVRPDAATTPRRIGWRRGDVVQVASDGTLPAGLALATDYYVMPDSGGGFRLAASYADALADTAVAVTDAGTGVHTVTRTAEARYAGGAVLEASVARKAAFEALLSGSGGRAVWTGGAWRLGGAEARVATLTLDEGDLRGPIKLRTRLARRDRFNAVEGQYASPDAGGQAVSFPTVSSAAFAALDGETVTRRVDFPATDSAATCQRLARILLLRMRQEITAELTVSLKSLALTAGDWVALDNTRFGWAGKVFDVETWQFAVEDGDGGPALLCRLGLRETDASSYDWTTSLETTVDPAPNTLLPSPWDIEAPSGLGLAETLFVTRDGAGVKARATLSWMAVDNGFVAAGGRYAAEYRSTAATDWIALPRTVETFVTIDDIAPDVYEFRVQAVGRTGATSQWSDILEQETLGLLAPPADIQNLRLGAISALAVLSWERPADLDVRIGGRIRIRHSPLTAGATWANASEISDPLPGDSTQVVLPLIAGSYLLRAYDSSFVPSDNAVSVTTAGAQVLAFADVASIDEHAAFAGTHSGTAAPDGVLKLDGAGLFDDIADFDALDSLDTFGGITTGGTYIFAAGIDLGAVERVRLRAHIEALSSNILDLIDSRTDDIDDWEDFDGATAAEADVRMFTRVTDDDPAGSPVWGPWQRLVAAEFEHRAFQFKVDLATSDPAYTVLVTELGVRAEQSI
jgi:hypothetical protein